MSKLTMGRCKSPVCLIGKTVLVTGGNSEGLCWSWNKTPIRLTIARQAVTYLQHSPTTVIASTLGIGFQTALALAGRGCRLIIADKDDCTKSRQKIIEETGNTNIVIKRFDLTSLSSVRKLAKDINKTEKRLDILINNAGTGGAGNSVTEDGLHILMQINHFGTFLLTHLLVGLLKKSAPSRIIFVSSIAALITSYLTEENLNGFERQSSNLISDVIIYSNSKVCSVITARGFAAKLKGTGVTSNFLHPGVVNTPFLEKISYGSGNYKIEKYINYFFMRYIVGLNSKTPEEGAQTTLHLALSKEVENVTGEYFLDCKQFLIPVSARNEEFARKIWKASEEHVKLTPSEKV